MDTPGDKTPSGAGAEGHTGLETTMWAIVQDSYGSADVLELRDVERPEISDNEVLVQVRSAGVDRGAWHVMTGIPYLVRVMGFGLRSPKVSIPGSNIAGRVEAVGKAVADFRPGDEVLGVCKGAYAEYACAREDRLAPKPTNLTFEQAAVVPHGGLTALQALRDHGKLQPDQTVLIVGASGAVGSFAVQLATALGAEVTGVCSPAKADLVRELGAGHIIDYTRNDIVDDGRRYDLVLDIGGNRSVAELRRVLTTRGTLVIVGGEAGGPWTGGLHRQLGANLRSLFVRQKLGTFIAKEHSDELIALNEFIEAGQVMPVIDRTFPLDEAADAIRFLEAGGARGQLAITI